MALTNIQEIVERSLFESIRTVLVSEGYLPDIVNYPDTLVGSQNYDIALQDIIIDKGFAIDLFNVGSNQSKGVKKIPRITLDSGSFLPGAIGGDPLKYFRDNTTSFTALVTPPQTVDFYTNFILSSNTVQQERILNAILALAIPRRGYIKWYNDSTKTFFIRYISYFDTDSNNTGIIEKSYGYEIPDCWDSDDLEVTANIAKISEITFQPILENYYQGGLTYNSTPSVINNTIP